MQSNVMIAHAMIIHSYIIYFVFIQIADFGMSRDLIDENYYITSGGKVPVKWTALEVTISVLIVSYIYVCHRYELRTHFTIHS